jgi:hypothetical protein
MILEKAVEEHFTAKPQRAQRTYSQIKLTRLVKSLIISFLIRTFAFLSVFAPWRWKFEFLLRFLG